MGRTTRLKSRGNKGRAVSSPFEPECRDACGAPTKLRTVLEPFAKAADYFDPDTIYKDDNMPGYGITLGDLRRARKALRGD